MTPVTGGRREWQERRDRRQEWYPPDRQERFRVMPGLAGAVAGPGPVVPDLACGTGSVTDRGSAGPPGADCTGADLAPVLPAIARGAFEGDRRARSVTADLRDPGRTSEPFEVVRVFWDCPPALRIQVHPPQARKSPRPHPRGRRARGFRGASAILWCVGRRVRRSAARRPSRRTRRDRCRTRRGCGRRPSRTPVGGTRSAKRQPPSNPHAADTGLHPVHGAEEVKGPWTGTPWSARAAGR